MRRSRICQIGCPLLLVALTFSFVRISVSKLLCVFLSACIQIVCPDEMNKFTQLDHTDIFQHFWRKFIFITDIILAYTTATNKCIIIFVLLLVLLFICYIIINIYEGYPQPELIPDRNRLSQLHLSSICQLEWVLRAILSRFCNSSLQNIQYSRRKLNELGIVQVMDFYSPQGFIFFHLSTDNSKVASFLYILFYYKYIIHNFIYHIYRRGCVPQHLPQQFRHLISRC